MTPALVLTIMSDGRPRTVTDVWHAINDRGYRVTRNHVGGVLTSLTLAGKVKATGAQAPRIYERIEG